MPSLNWIGRKAVENHHRQVPFHLLEEVIKERIGNHDSDNLLVEGDNLTALKADNLLVEGDNLTALKALLPHYKGSVKCIYIDPPYNTGEEKWVYNDNVNSQEMRDWLGKVVGGELDDLSRHDKWLCMMYPRLTLLREFLREDGSIWISIDDSEVHHLRLLMDEIFGRDKFVAMNVWQKRYSRENREAIGDVHEYIVVYARNPQKFKATRNKVPPDAKQTKVYRNPNNDPKGRWRPIPMTAQAGHATAEQFYEITAPGGKVFVPPEGRCWGIAKATFEKLLSEGRIYFGKNNNSQPNIIRYLSEVEGFAPWTWWPNEEVGHTDEAKKEVHAILGKENAFDTPKPLRLLQRILEIATNPGDLILDSFAGTGTTGHAAMTLNHRDKGERRFILVEMDKHICRSNTKKRLQAAIDGYTQKDGTQSEPINSGCKFARLGVPLFDESGRINQEVTFSQLAKHVYFTETGMPLSKQIQSPLIGEYADRAIYLLFNGILKDRTPTGGNVLTTATLGILPKSKHPKVVYGAACRLSAERLRKEQITFKQLPYRLKVEL